MKRIITQHWAVLLLILLVLCLVALGVMWLDVPPIYRIAHHAPFMVYRGYVALGLAALLVCAHRWVIGKMMWLSAQIYRWVSALTMLGVVGIDATMHLLNVPHMEGWWLPLIGGSGLISSSLLWLKQKAINKNRHKNELSSSK